MTNTHSLAQGFVGRVHSLVTENNRITTTTSTLVYIYAALAVAAGGVALYTTPRTFEGRKNRRRRKSPVKHKPRDAESGHIVEGILVEDLPNFGVLTEEQPEGMSTEERAKLAAALGERGNCHYRRSFERAAKFYTRAIIVSPTEEHIYYGNRGACYINMRHPEFELAVKDCDKAIALDKDYVEAIDRRARALEALDRLEEALRDYTTTMLLDGFENKETVLAVERVLRKLSSAKAAEIVKTRDIHTPTYAFTASYFSVFRPRSLPSLPEEPTVADDALIAALRSLQAADYDNILSSVVVALEGGLSSCTLRAEALNLRGTFKFLMYDMKGAERDFLESIDLVPSFTQSWVKIAGVYMEQGNTEKAFEAFEEAIKHNPNDPDIYFHSGQAYFAMGKFDQAATNYNKAIVVDDWSVFNHLKLAVAQYKGGQLTSAMATLRGTIKLFPGSEPLNSYGELLLNQGCFQDAINKFNRAIGMENTKVRQNVLPMVNKGLALFKWRQDIGAPEKLCHEALELDPDCETAVATLARLSLRQGKFDAAVDLFDRQLELARSESELANILAHKYATTAQKTFLENYPERKYVFSAMRQAMVPEELSSFFSVSL